MTGPIIAVPAAQGSASTLSSREWLRLIEGLGLTGCLAWMLDADAMTWSDGIFEILGLDPAIVRPSLAELLNAVHPDDRQTVSEHCELIQVGQSSACTFRVLRPDRAERTVTARWDLAVSADGRPVRVEALWLDVTQTEALRQRYLTRRSWMKLFFESERVLLTEALHFPRPECIDRLAVLTGLGPRDIAEDPARIVVPEDRDRFRAEIVEGRRPARETYVYRLAVADGGSQPFSFTPIPLEVGERRDAELRYLIAPDQSGVLDEAIVSDLRADHLRAARALLNWSISDLSERSQLGVSTVRRIETDPTGVKPVTYRALILALLDAGVRFVKLSDGRIGIARQSAS